jgi:hypothetical protein
MNRQYYIYYINKDIERILNTLVLINNVKAGDIYVYLTYIKLFKDNCNKKLLERMYILVQSLLKKDIDTIHSLLFNNEEPIEILMLGAGKYISKHIRDMDVMELELMNRILLKLFKIYKGEQNV